MAKLSARNRQTVVEVVREFDARSLQARHDRFQRSYKADYVDGSDPALTVWERCTRRLMSDGTILEKSDVRFQPSPNCSWEDPNGRRHSYGWKVHGKIKAGVTPEKFAEVYAANTKSGKPSPWTVTAGNRPAPVIISQARIMAAVKRDDMTGFCTECGSEQGGVEPDANSYRCEGCGAMAVSGAENLLLEIA